MPRPAGMTWLWSNRFFDAPMLALAVVAVLLAVLLPDRFQQHVLALVLLWAIAGQSWNLSYGYAGQLSFGHSVFVGIGAYAFVLLLRRYGLSPFGGMAVGMLCAGAVAALVGYPTLRLTGAYFALATIVLPLIAIVIVASVGLQELTIPLTGFQSATYMYFATPRDYSLLAIGSLLVTMVVVTYIDRGRIGHLLRAVRDNEVLAESLGVDTVRLKLGAFVVSAAMAAAFGVLWVETALLIVASQDVFSLAIVIQMISISLVGGVGSRWGPVIGAAILVPIAENLNVTYGSHIPGVQVLAYGALLMLVILVAPDGLHPLLARGLRRFSLPVETAGERPAEPAEAPVRIARDETLLSLRDATKRFGGITALRSVSLDVRARQIVGVIGPNGAGKTTLLNIVTSIYLPDAGQVRLAGADVTRARPHVRCRLGLARTFQTPQMLVRLSVRGNVMPAAFNSTRSLAGAHRLTSSALATVGLGDVTDRPVTSLTTLQVKLLEIARALATQPTLLLMDESMSGLSREEQTTLLGLVRQLRDSGLTIVMIEHAIGSLLKVADRLVVLVEGTKLVEGSGQEVIGDRRVIEAYLGSRWAAQPRG